MNWIDFIVVAVVVILVGLIVFFSFIYKRKERKDRCAYCSEGAGKKKNRLKSDFDNKYRKKK